MTLDEFVRVVGGGLIASCQAGTGHPLRDSPTIARMARAAVLGGATAIRCGGVGGVPDIQEVASAVEVPIIGLTKRGIAGVFITPTADDALQVLAAGAAVVATDGTRRRRPDGTPLLHTVEAVQAAGGLVMADVATVDDGIAAAAAGADMIATTLSGYTADSPQGPGPDLDLVAALSRALPSTVIVAEGRYHRPEQVRAALDAGATAVVVGTAITDPAWIAGSFAAHTDRPRRG
ncbi:putative N-acetylmannosamine-6-phosphate 2-epimerase [Actinoplanes sp. NPDC023801]|uniref:N-acetylmannosamine-6-phosphate 2-epimerase n=1 Tax=Actinoplanes sp. NPDC023801 TaxID=3154595 RepID=UPI0033F08533